MVFLGFLHIRTTDEKWLTGFLSIIRHLLLSVSNLAVKLYSLLYSYGPWWTQVLVFYALHWSTMVLLGIAIFLLILTMDICFIYGQWLMHFSFVYVYVGHTKIFCLFQNFKDLTFETYALESHSFSPLSRSFYCEFPKHGIF